MSWGSTEATLEDLQASLPHQPTVPKHPAIPRVIYVQKIQFYPYVKSAIFLASHIEYKNLKMVKNECFRLIHFQLYMFNDQTSMETQHFSSGSGSVSQAATMLFWWDLIMEDVDKKKSRNKP